MNKGPEHPKVSFLVARQTLNKVSDFAAKEEMTMSEAMRFLIEAGLEKIAEPRTITRVSIPTDTMEQEFQSHHRRGYELGYKAGLAAKEQAQAPLGEGATRGKFPRPTGATKHETEQ